MQQPVPFQRLLNAALLAAVGAGLLLGLAYHWMMVTLPGTQDYREGAMLDATALFLKGDHPYRWENLPGHLNVYGPGYQWLVQPWAQCFGNTLLVHRAVAGAFLLASCGLLCLWLRLAGIQLLLCVGAAVVFYLQNLLTYAIVARPDLPGLFFFLATLGVAWHGRRSRIALIGSILLGLGATLIKTYFILALPVSAMALFLFHRKKIGLIYGGAAVLSVTALALAIDHYWPAYFFSTWVVPRAAGTPHLAVGFTQATHFVLRFGPMLILLGWTCWKVITKRPEGGQGLFSKLRLNYRHGSRPLLDFPLDIIPVAGLVGFLVLLWQLGWHTGSYMVYWVHLLGPFVVLGAMTAAGHLPDRSAGWRISSLALLATLAITAFLAPPWPRSHARNHADWQAILRAPGEVLVHPTLVDVALASGHAVPDNGQTEYFWLGVLTANPDQVSFRRQIFRQHIATVREKMSRREYRLIIFDNGVGNIFFEGWELRQHYRQVAESPKLSYYGFAMSTSLYNEGAYTLGLYVPKERP